MAYYNKAGTTPCKYFQQGRCNRGNSCKFAHVYTSNNSAQGQANENGMSELELYKSFVNPSSLPKIEKSILDGLKDAENFQMKPLSSAYSYGTPCLVNLISGRDYSPEESRSQFYESQKNGLSNQYEVEMKARESDMLKCFAHIRAHPDWAARFLQKNTKDLSETGQLSMKNEFVNFQLDLGGSSYQNNGPSSFGPNPFTSGKSTLASNSGGGGPFGGSTTGIFGQPSFGKSGGAFGAGTNSTTTSNESAFGAPSFGASAFGAPAFGAPAFGTPAFGSNIGSTTNNSGANVFGKPAFGSSASSSPAASVPFGNSASVAPSMNTNSAFGKPQFGSSAQGLATTGTGNAFGTPSFGPGGFANQSKPAFGASGFGSSSFSANKSSTAASPFGNSQNAINSISNTTHSLFGGPTASPFASLQNGEKTSSPFGASQNTINQGKSPFMQSTGTGSSPFSSINQQSSSQQASTSFGNLQSGLNAQPFGSNLSQTASFSQATDAQNNVGQTPFGKPSVNPFATVNNTHPAKMITSTLATSQRNFLQGLPSEFEKIKIDDLDKETIEIFQSKTFTLGQVPDIPPPLALISVG